MDSIPRFAIFYADGSVVEGGGPDDDLVPLLVSRKWLEAPSDGVVVVAQKIPGVRNQRHYNSDYYYAFPANHHGAGEIGCAFSIGPFLRQLGLVKFGGWTGTENYERIKTTAFHYGWQLDEMQDPIGREPDSEGADR